MPSRARNIFFLTPDLLLSVSSYIVDVVHTPSFCSQIKEIWKIEISIRKGGKIAASLENELVVGEFSCLYSCLKPSNNPNCKGTIFVPSV